MEIYQKIEEYLHYCEKVRGMTPVTIRTKRDVLTRFVEHTQIFDVEEITNDTINAWVEFLVGRNVNARSANVYNSVIKSFLKYCREMGVIVGVNLNLVRKMKETKCQRKFYSAAEVLKVVKTTDEVTGLQILVMFETGMRIAELCKLRIDNFEGRRVCFVAKGRKMREAYVTIGTLGLLRKYVKRYKINGNLWCGYDGLRSLNGEPPTINTVRLHMRKAFENAGFKGFYPHALRHSFATDLQLRGASVAEIKEMIGHSSVATTERYLHGFDGKMKELFDKYR